MSGMPPRPVSSPFPSYFEKSPLEYHLAVEVLAFLWLCVLLAKAFRDGVLRVSFPLVRVAFLAALSGVHLNPSTDLENVGFFFSISVGPMFLF